MTLFNQNLIRASGNLTTTFRNPTQRSCYSLSFLPPLPMLVCPPGRRSRHRADMCQLVGRPGNFTAIKGTVIKSYSTVCQRAECACGSLNLISNHLTCTRHSSALLISRNQQRRRYLDLHFWMTAYFGSRWHFTINNTNYRFCLYKICATMSGCGGGV